MYIQVSLLLIFYIPYSEQFPSNMINNYNEIAKYVDRGDAVMLLILDGSHDDRETEIGNIQAFDLKCAQYPKFKCVHGFQTESNSENKFTFVKARVSKGNLPMLVFFNQAQQRYLFEPESDGYLNDDEIEKAAKSILNSQSN